MRKHGAARKGFSLIELLTVIAIIALLAAMIFPVFNAARNKVRENTVMSQMHDIGVALKLYREDFGKYPATLLGYAQAGDGSFITDGGQTPTTIEQLTYRPLTLGQKYIKDKQVFTSPYYPGADPRAVVPAVYPFNYFGGPGAPVLFTPRMLHNMEKDDLIPTLAGQRAYFYRYDSVTLGPQIYVDLDGKIKTAIDGNGQPLLELHYSLDWTGLNPGPSDDARQLKYNNPPEDRTVVTWCTDPASLSGSEMIPVLFLSGKVRPIPAKRFLENGPLPPPGVSY